MTASRHAPGGGELSRLLGPLADLASRAGARILEIAARGDTPRTKSDASPVTAADEAAESILLEGLARILPGVPVVAEESISRSGPSRPPARYLLVDPIDGTRELIAGRDEYTVNIALIEDRRPMFGMIYAPSLRMLYAGDERGAWRAALVPGTNLDVGTLAPIRARPRPARLVALVSRSHPDPASDKFLAGLAVEQRIALGSSLKFARLAEGAADVYARLATVNEWDIAAGHALLTAAGGTVKTPSGSALSYGAREIGFRVDGFVAWGAPGA
jgi:3'(2'), 5'-bisphosphate nucleotidase